MSQERSRGFVVVASLFLATLAYGIGLLAMSYAQGVLVRLVSLRLVLIFSEIALALPALIVAFILAGQIPEVYRFRPFSSKAVLATFVLGLAFWGLSLGVFEAQYVFVKPPLAYLEQFQGLHEMLKPVGPLGWVFSIGAIAVAPAVCEEILFRGLLTPVFSIAAGRTLEAFFRDRFAKALRGTIAQAFAIVVSAALFARIHVDTMADGTQVYYRVPFAFVLGMLLAKLRLDCGSLWPPMIAHATLNATTFIVVFLVEEPKGVLPDPQPLVALGMLAVGSVVARVLMRRIRPEGQLA